MSFFGIPMRNGLSLGLGTVASLTNGPGFLPDELFYGGIVQGAWYDPSDLTTLFQDSAGTTPVTAVEQAVGLMLDKSKGLVLGPELLADPGFDNAGSWETSAGVTITGGEAVWNTAGTSVYVRQSSIIAANSYYEFTIVCSSYTSGSVIVALGAGGSTLPAYPIDKVGTVSFRYNVGVNSGRVWLLTPAGGAQLSITSFSVKQVTGNHAYQTTSASRPTLRARYNLLTYSEQFDNAAWAKRNINAFGSGSVANTTATLDPLGGNTADFIQESTANGIHGVDNNAAVTLSAAQHTASFAVKAATRTWCYVRLATTTGQGAYFNLANGTIGTVESGITASITPLGNGWYRCSVTITTSTAPWYPSVNTALGDNQGSYTGDGTSGIFIWGAQLVPTAVFPSNTYQRIGAATDYATGAAFPPYLFFDGTDDSMLTNSVDFTGTDKMLVVAGVTKNSDAALGMLVELSALANANGSFFVTAPRDAATANYSVSAASTANLDARITTFAAPITNVLAAAINLGGSTDANVIAIKANGAAVTPAYTGSRGTGNFGNHPLYIGRRNNASLPFNGNLYSLIIAGQSYAAGQVTSTEQWVAAKTPLGTI